MLWCRTTNRQGAAAVLGRIDKSRAPSFPAPVTQNGFLQRQLGVAAAEMRDGHGATSTSCSPQALFSRVTSAQKCVLPHPAIFFRRGDDENVPVLQVRQTRLLSAAVHAPVPLTGVPWPRGVLTCVPYAWYPWFAGACRAGGVQVTYPTHPRPRHHGHHPYPRRQRPELQGFRRGTVMDRVLGF
jgi:hypothetical protein